MSTRRLILIKHAAPAVVPDVPPERWVLSAEGRRRCGPLADAVRPHAPAVVAASREPKAGETAEAVAAQLGVPFATVDGLHEHDRSNVPHLRSREFISLMEVFFRKPTELVLGRETAEQAFARFAGAVDRVLADHPQGNVAVVSHGTVIALFLARHGAGKPFELWRQMGLPSFAVVQAPAFRVEAVTGGVPA
jgi:broad specificity phosphatase PhoE